MPLPMVHLSIANELKNIGFTIQDFPMFYLGNISPDAIHMRENSDRIAKKITHLGRSSSVSMNWTDESEEEYIEIMLKFFETNKNIVNNNFLLGYIIHILTDLYWAKSVLMDFDNEYKNDLLPNQDERTAYYNDTDLIDLKIFLESPWRGEIWENLEKVKEFDFLDLLSGNEIYLWKERTLNWFITKDFSQLNPIKYISEKTIDNFIKQCSRKINGIIQN